MNRFVVLGSANAVTKQGQDNTHLLIETCDRSIMIDCGVNPVAKLAAAGTSIKEVTDLIITHFHADHVGSLPLLLMDMWLEKRQKPLVISGLQFTLDRAKHLLQVFDWEKWQGIFPVEFFVIPDEGKEGFISPDSIRVSAFPVKHLVPTLGFKFEFPDERVVVYSCDTEPCENLSIQSAGADVLVQEVAGESKGHTSARQAGRLASDAGVKKLVLIHYDNRVGTETLFNDARSNFSGEIVVAQDLMLI